MFESLVQDNFCQSSAQFSQILASLTPSLQSLMTAARFALKNAANEDYLFPHFPQTNVQELMLKYETQNELLTAEDLTNIENDVPFSEQPPTPSPQDTEDPLISAWKILVWKKRQSRYERIRIQKHSDVITGEIQEEEMFNLDDKQLLSRQQITMRMESDRESHKRSKETLWIVNRPHEPNYVTEEEFAHNYWNKVQKMSSEEYSSLLDVLGDLNKLVRSSFKDNIA
ncbi:uncharacterized protein KQ657_005126 [Scheffersomyces spartinae]|uniref:Uncharacterized protein n=1 Tax=Scheffersomyces spartinae TaxID=45513 RepID=A0A9P7V9T5_9ASCO|nr:uncharacterized protein KQ657_005126 [Scheffersomyces spartinae]KAG7193927.1 hypothetical protein KQ657_005126 [Scheffersomyces spartinae]